MSNSKQAYILKVVLQYLMLSSVADFSYIFYPASKSVDMSVHIFTAQQTDNKE